MDSKFLVVTKSSCLPLWFSDFNLSAPPIYRRCISRFQSKLHSRILLVTFLDYFSACGGGKNGLVRGLFHSILCGLKIGDTPSLLYDVTQSLKLWKTSKEKAHCRDHPSQSFRTPINKDLQDLKPLSTSENPKTISLDIWSSGTRQQTRQKTD